MHFDDLKTFPRGQKSYHTLYFLLVWCWWWKRKRSLLKSYCSSRHTETVQAQDYILLELASTLLLYRKAANFQSFLMFSSRRTPPNSWGLSRIDKKILVWQSNVYWPRWNLYHNCERQTISVHKSWSCSGVFIGKYILGICALFGM